MFLIVSEEQKLSLSSDQLSLAQAQAPTLGLKSFEISKYLELKTKYLRNFLIN
jgi:hypothetical protein